MSVQSFETKQLTLVFFGVLQNMTPSIDQKSTKKHKCRDARVKHVAVLWKTYSKTYHEGYALQTKAQQILLKEKHCLFSRRRVDN